MSQLKIVQLDTQKKAIKRVFNILSEVDNT